MALHVLYSGQHIARLYGTEFSMPFSSCPRRPSRRVRRAPGRRGADGTPPGPIHSSTATAEGEPALAAVVRLTPVDASLHVGGRPVVVISCRPRQRVPSVRSRGFDPLNWRTLLSSVTEPGVLWPDVVFLADGPRSFAGIGGILSVHGSTRSDRRWTGGGDWARGRKPGRWTTHWSSG
jgi:hypothetical protein